MGQRDEPPRAFPFFIGCQRSGTTLLRVIFDHHPLLAVTRESYFIPWLAARAGRYERAGGFDERVFVGDLARNRHVDRWGLPIDRVERSFADRPAASLADAIRRLYELKAARRGKERYGDKTPEYALHVPLLARMFPESRFVHVIRDGRDVALSLTSVPWGPARVGQAALFWRARVEAARAAGAALGKERYFEYHHEQLAREPDPIVADICAFIDLPFDAAMLRYHETATPRAKEQGRHLAEPPTPGLRDWRAQMPVAGQRLFEILAGDLLAELGYDTATDTATLGAAGERAARRTATRERMRHAARTSAAARAAWNVAARTPLGARGSVRPSTGTPRS
ncbi:MAG TPA: sulfotransferase [Actinomycetota bacterium]